MFIKTLYDNYINSALITEIYISKPEFEQNTYNICAKVHLNGVFILAECKTETHAKEQLNHIVNILNKRSD